MPEIKTTETQGEWRDICCYKDGTVKETEWEHNIIVFNINILIACLFSNRPNINGITYWAVGHGLNEWDNLYPDIPMDSTRASLLDEFGRKRVSEIVFLNENNEVVGNRTNRIRITAMFESGDCNGVWREFALFGGDATSDINTGIMIDHKSHQKYIKTSDVRVERQIRFIFQ